TSFATWGRINAEDAGLSVWPERKHGRRRAMRLVVSAALLAAVAAIVLLGCAQKSATKTAARSKSVEGRRKADTAGSSREKTADQNASQGDAATSDSQPAGVEKEAQKSGEPVEPKATEKSAEPEPKETVKEPAGSSEPT